MNSMVRERESHVSRLFIEVTPGIRRALELLAEASITLLDEIDAPVDGLEADEDFELECEDEGAQCDDEGDPGGDHEPDLGWNVDGEYTGEWAADEDFADPETSSGFPRGGDLDFAVRSQQKALFDPRISRRGADPNRTTWTNSTGDVFGFGRIPPFPHERPDRPAFHIEAEIRRLTSELRPKLAKRNKARRNPLENSKR